MSRQVDIWWASKNKLEASMRWTNKRGRISFSLVPTYDILYCEDCSFWKNPICCKWRSPVRKDMGFLCDLLWKMSGDNKFKGRDRIIALQPTGPIKRGKRKG